MSFVRFMRPMYLNHTFENSVMKRIKNQLATEKSFLKFFFNKFVRIIFAILVKI